MTGPRRPKQNIWTAEDMEKALSFKVRVGTKGQAEDNWILMKIHWKQLELCDGIQTWITPRSTSLDSNHYKILDIVASGSIDEISERVVVEKQINPQCIWRSNQSLYPLLQKGNNYRAPGVKPWKWYSGESVSWNGGDAIVPRTWDLSQSIRIECSKDRVEITSPGGSLPNLSGKNSWGKYRSWRNPIIAGVFARLGIIEKFGTRKIRRINECYKEMRLKPEFGIFENSIRSDACRPKMLLSALDSWKERNRRIAETKWNHDRREIETASGHAGRTKVIRILRCEFRNRLSENGTGREPNILLLG